MIAKILISIAGFIALAPQILSLKYRLLFNGVAVGGIAGLIGTATRLEPAAMVPVNMFYGVLTSLVVTAVLHFGLEAFLRQRQRA